MKHPSQSGRATVRRPGGLASTLLVLLLSVLVLPMTAAPAGAATAGQASSSAPDFSSLLDVDGSASTEAGTLGAVPAQGWTTVSSLPGDGSAIAVKATSLSTLSSSSSGSGALLASSTAGAPVVLGAPSETPVQLGLDSDGFACTVLIPCSWKDAGKRAKVAGCSTIVLSLFIGVHECVDAVKDRLSEIGKALVPQVKALLQELNKWVKDWAQGVSRWVLIDELGSKNTVQNPLLDCKVAQGAQAEKCDATKPNWFIGQYSLMRQIGLFMLLPLLMLVVIQSVVRGSMFFLVRAVLIMLPTAIIGTVVAMTMAQLLLNVSDDFSDSIGHYMTDKTCTSGIDTESSNCYGTLMDQKIESISGDSFGLFGIAWLIVFSLAAVVIMIEMMLRQTGIYLAAFFLPIGFAGLVWPATAKWAKRLIELIIGLIFSKVFIVAALSLGMTAMTQSGTNAQDKDKTGVDGTQISQSKDDQSLATVMGGAAVLIMAAFAGTKVIAITPATLGANEGRVANTGNFWKKGLGAQQALGMVGGRMGKSNANIRPK